MYHTKKKWQKYLELMKERPELFCDGLYEIITDDEAIDTYHEKTGAKLGVRFESEYSILLLELVRNRLRDKETMFTYQRMIPKTNNPGVVAIPFSKGRFVLLKQFRHATRREEWSFPRGFGERNMTTEENLKLELHDELNAGNIWNVQKIGTIAPDTGLSATVAEVYKCTVEHAAPKEGYEGIREVKLVSEEELVQMIRDGEITDGFTLAAYTLYKASE